MDKTLLKGLRVLELLATSDRPLGVTEVAQHMDLLKSNAHRVLQTLVAAGYAAPVPETGRYRPTLKLWSLGSAVAVSTDLRAIAAPLLGRLRDVTGETAFLALLDGTDVTFVEIQPSARALRVHTAVGARMPAYCTSPGKVLLAFEEPIRDASELLPLQHFTQTTVADVEALRSELKKIRRQGYAVNSGEYREEVSGVAVPVFDAYGKAIASTGISGPSERFRPAAIKEWLPAVLKAGTDISHMMGAKT